MRSAWMVPSSRPLTSIDSRKSTRERSRRLRVFHLPRMASSRHLTHVARGLILRNGAATIGLFQGMFEKNILTFNPGWDSNPHSRWPSSPTSGSLQRVA